MRMAVWPYFPECFMGLLIGWASLQLGASTCSNYLVLKKASPLWRARLPTVSLFCGG